MNKNNSNLQMYYKENWVVMIFDKEIYNSVNQIVVSSRELKFLMSYNNPSSI